MSFSFPKLGGSLPFSRLFSLFHCQKRLASSSVSCNQTDINYILEAALKDRNEFSEIQKESRQMEQEMETVVNVLKPGPLGIIEHKFSAEEIQNAKATVKRAVRNWRMNADVEQTSRDHILRDYILK